MKYKSPEKVDPLHYKSSVFIGGSIEDGKAENWQDRMVDFFHNLGFNTLNPRRDNWGELTKEKMTEQLDWEVDSQAECSLNFYYFHPDTKAPITLLELGLFVHKLNVIVVCPPEFYRFQNVEYICDRYGVPLFKSLDEFELYFPFSTWYNVAKGEQNE